MKKYEIGIKNVHTGNIYYTGHTIKAVDRNDAIINYCTWYNETCNPKLIYANEVE